MKTWSGVVQLSPLQLLEYTFEGLSVALTPDYDNANRDTSSVVAPSTMTLETECGIADIQDKDAFSDYALKLILKVTPSEAASAPYSLTVAVRGLFRMHRMSDEKDLGDRKDRALVNGITVLYGVAREMVTTITSRSANGQMLLPTLKFSDLAKASTATANGPTKPIAAKKTARARAAKTR
jgi:preprotein translocase subunit SecB